MNTVILTNNVALSKESCYSNAYKDLKDWNEEM